MAHALDVVVYPFHGPAVQLQDLGGGVDCVCEWLGPIRPDGAHLAQILGQDQRGPKRLDQGAIDADNRSITCL